MEKKYKIGLAIVIYIVMLLLWSMPISDKPFGDVDASTHFTLSDYQSYNNKVIVELPYYINFVYGNNNDGKIWYAPQFHLLGAISQLIGGRIKGIFIFYLLGSTLIFWTLFFFVNRLYGYWPALLASSMLIFSKRDYLTYIWGLWPERLAFAFTPIILYCLYKYYDSYLNGNPKNIYVYILPLLVASQFFMHPQGIMISFVLITIYSVIMIITERKLPFDYKRVLIAALILAIVFLPFIQYPLGFQKNINEQSLGDEIKIQEIGSLFRWYPKSIPYRPDFADFGQMHGGWWILPFILLGLVFLLFRRDRANLLILSWFIGHYVLIHFNVIGLTSRIHRFLNAEAHIFYLVAVLGAWFLFSWVEDHMIKIYDLRKYLSVLLVILFLFMTGPEAINNLSNAYEGIGRVTESEMLACGWIHENLPEDADIRNVGTVVYSNRKWIQALCFRHFIYDDKTLDASMSPEADMTEFVFLDNDNLVKVGYQPVKLNNTLIYSSQGVEVYDVRT